MSMKRERKNMRKKNTKNKIDMQGSPNVITTYPGFGSQAKESENMILNKYRDGREIFPSTHSMEVFCL